MITNRVKYDRLQKPWADNNDGDDAVDGDDSNNPKARVYDVFPLIAEPRAVRRHGDELYTFRRYNRHKSPIANDSDVYTPLSRRACVIHLPYAAMSRTENIQRHFSPCLR